MTSEYILLLRPLTYFALSGTLICLSLALCGQVLRVRSQVEIANSMTDLSMHVGVAAEAAVQKDEKRGRRRYAADGARFDWEAVVVPGESSNGPRVGVSFHFGYACTLLDWRPCRFVAFRLIFAFQYT